MVIIEEIVDRPWETIAKKRTIENRGNIPKIIHLIQKFFPLKKDQRIVEGWKRSHPDWVCVLWNDSDASEYIREFHPSYCQNFQMLKISYQKMDAFKPFLYHDFGGVVMDLTECKIDLENQLREDDQFVTLSSKTIKSFFITTPRNPVWKQCWKEGIQNPWNNPTKGLKIPIRYIQGSQEGGETSSVTNLPSIHEGWVIVGFIILVLGFCLSKIKQKIMIK
jgi:hypothetical protein